MPPSAEGHGIMRRIVIRCDGTWNKPDSENPTNGVNFARSIALPPGPAAPLFPRPYGRGGSDLTYRPISEPKL